MDTNEKIYHLIHANIAYMRAPLDDPITADFVMQAAEIDALSQRLPGFIAQPTPNDEGTEFWGNELLNLSMC